MKNRRLLTLLAAGSLVSAPVAVSAQTRTSLSIAGGISAPSSTFADHADAGYNLAGAVSFGAPLTPAGIRIEGAVNGFNSRTTGLVTYTGTRIITGTVNATIALGRTGSSPYLIGGVGAYNRRFVADGSAGSDRTAGGFNAGAGFRFPLGTMSTFVEARYHQMLGNAADGTDFRFVPVTFGITF